MPLIPFTTLTRCAKVANKNILVRGEIREREIEADCSTANQSASVIVDAPGDEAFVIGSPHYTPIATVNCNDGQHGGYSGLTTNRVRSGHVESGVRVCEFKFGERVN